MKQGKKEIWIIKACDGNLCEGCNAPSETESWEFLWHDAIRTVRETKSLREYITFMTKMHGYRAVKIEVREV